MSEQKIDYRRYDYTKARLEEMSLNDLIDELHRLEDIEDNRDELMFILKDLLDRYDPEDAGAAFEPDSGCFDCTSGTVPNNLNTGPCPYHRVIAALKAAKRDGQ